MGKLNVKELLELLDKAVQLSLSPDFINLVFDELIERFYTERDKDSIPS